MLKNENLFLGENKYISLQGLVNSDQNVRELPYLLCFLC